MKRVIKYIIGTIVVIGILYLSADIRKLDVRDSEKTSATFDPDKYSNEFWETKLPVCIDKAISITELKQMLSKGPEKAFNNYAHKLGISKTFYFFIKGTGKIRNINEEKINVTVNENTQVDIASLYIFGNAIRDGSGMVDINRFLNMTDFNKISVLLNKRVKKEIVAPMIEKAKPGMTIEFVGAAEINSEEIKADLISIIPVKITLTDGE
jgi:predicted lipoprotein